MHRLTIRVTTSYPNFPLERQLPGTSREWGNCKFIINEPCGPCDWWVVASGLISPEIGYCDPAHTVFVANEPAERTYPQGFLEQFAIVISCDPNVHHPGRVLTHYGLPWWAGVTMSLQQPHQFSRVARFDYDDFKAMTRPAKPKKMSVISSRLTLFDGHIKRAAFIEELKRRFAREIDFFGYDSNPLADKWDGLAPYRYHVCLENTVHPHYWTEKIADPLLAYSLPIYSGGSNIADYFPEGSFLPINIQETDEACGEIERVLAVDPYEDHAASVAAARDLVLNKYNFFAMIADLCTLPARKQRKICLNPESAAPVRRTWRHLAKGLARRVAPAFRKS